MACNVMNAQWGLDSATGLRVHSGESRLDGSYLTQAGLIRKAVLEGGSLCSERHARSLWW